MYFWTTAQSPLVVDHASVGPLVSLFTDKTHKVLTDTLIVPAVVAAASTVLLLLHLFLVSVWGRKLRAFLFKTSESEVVDPVPPSNPSVWSQK
ncbi:hypothetical protein B0H13DRAFT_2320699 [Mycena leptocephala]|nr:hypothetical protein B0H13DRAFT_2320699 [Mycena leptocephala]